MKTYKTYLLESAQTYDFKIKIACDIADADITRIKNALEEFKIANFSKPRKLPIQDSPEFPNMGPVEVKIYDVSFEYPVNNDKLFSTITSIGCCQPSALKVIPANSPYNAVLDGKEISNVDGDTVLDTPELKAEKAEPTSGQEYLDKLPNLIKEIQAARKYEYAEAAGGKSDAAKTTNSLPQGNTSPVGTHKNKIPSPQKGKQ